MLRSVILATLASSVLGFAPIAMPTGLKLRAHASLPLSSRRAPTAPRLANSATR